MYPCKLLCCALKIWFLGFISSPRRGFGDLAVCTLSPKSVPIVPEFLPKWVTGVHLSFFHGDNSLWVTFCPLQSSGWMEVTPHVTLGDTHGLNMTTVIVGDPTTEPCSLVCPQVCHLCLSVITIFFSVCPCWGPSCSSWGTRGMTGCGRWPAGGWGGNGDSLPLSTPPAAPSSCPAQGPQLCHSASTA